MMVDLNIGIQTMKKEFHVSLEMTPDELVDVDFKVSVAGTLSDEEIIAEPRGVADIDDDEHIDDREPTEHVFKPHFMDVMNVSLLFLRTIAYFRPSVAI